jgi:hypothetical protein
MEWLDMREAFLAGLLLGVMSSNFSPYALTTVDWNSEKTNFQGRVLWHNGVKCHVTWCKFAGAPAHAGKHADLVSVSSRRPSSSSTLNPEGLRGLRIASSDTIYPALLTDA